MFSVIADVLYELATVSITEAPSPAALFAAARSSDVCPPPRIYTDINAFTREPEFYAYGMLCALTIAAIWQIFSSYIGFNTSSTHSISKGYS